MFKSVYMKASLQLKLSQQLMLTPQLQQAIRLLQLSTQDLNIEIQEALEKNPLLEVEGGDSNITVSKRSDLPLSETEVVKEAAPIEHYSSQAAVKPAPEKQNLLEQIYSTSDSLQDYLLWQLKLTPLSEVDYAIGVALIDNIGGDGLLTDSLESTLESLQEGGLDVTITDINVVRHRLQRFDPIGIASLNLQECLTIQLEQIALSPSQSSLVKQIINEDISLLAAHNYALLKKKYHINTQQLEEILCVIKQLHPKPGELIEPVKTEYIVPDVEVKKINDQWVVRLNGDAIPKLSINQKYLDLAQAKSSSDSRFIKNNLQEAKWLLKSIQSRQETLLNVATSIVKKQKAFLEHGEESLVPMVLNDIALNLDMHESTISRVTTKKYIDTPQGIFELKYFFSSHVSSDSGEHLSSKAIRAQIKRLISKENSKHPLSDHKIAQILKEQGINIARRTVTKYRTSLGIGASSERKSLSS